jgi:hypothetical protein
MNASKIGKIPNLNLKTLHMTAQFAHTNMIKPPRVGFLKLLSGII